MKFLRKRSGTLQLLNGNRKNIVIESIPAHVQKGFYLNNGTTENSVFGWQLLKMVSLKDYQLHQL